MIVRELKHRLRLSSPSLNSSVSGRFSVKMFLMNRRRPSRRLIFMLIGRLFRLSSSLCKRRGPPKTVAVSLSLLNCLFWRLNGLRAVSFLASRPTFVVTVFVLKDSTVFYD